VVPDEAVLEAERAKVRREYEQKMAEMKKQLQQAQQNSTASKTNNQDVELLKQKYEQQLKELSQKVR
jgi:hypothetical protein